MERFRRIIKNNKGNESKIDELQEQILNKEEFIRELQGNLKKWSQLYKIDLQLLTGFKNHFEKIKEEITTSLKTLETKTNILTDSVDGKMRELNQLSTKLDSAAEGKSKRRKKRRIKTNKKKR